MPSLTRLVVPMALALCVTLHAGPTQAGESRTHDGFFLRLSAGAGGAGTEVEVLDTDFEFRGTSGDINIAIGAVVASNLAIHGTLFGWSVGGPDLEVEGLGSAETDGDLTMSAFGGGLTYYFMPVNIYLSGSLGAGSLSFDGGDEDLEGESDTGIVGELTLGKEWWLGGSWGLGAAGAFGFHSIPDGGGIDENWTGTSWAIRLSATLN
jgi:hypothetical protein